MGLCIAPQKNPCMCIYEFEFEGYTVAIEYDLQALHFNNKALKICAARFLV